MDYRQLKSYNGFVENFETLKPTVSHNQCIYNKAMNKCDASAGYDPKTCYFPNQTKDKLIEPKCYSTTAVMCMSDEECKKNNKLQGCKGNTCRNPDPRAPQCVGDENCGFNPDPPLGGGPFSKDPKRGSFNCRNLGARSWCATPNIQCRNNSQCSLGSGLQCFPQKGASGGYKCEHSPRGFDSCRCIRNLPSDIADYRQGNPICTPELLADNKPCKFPGYI